MKKILWIILISLALVLTCQKKSPDNAHLLNQYIAAANSHDFEMLEDLISEEAVWHLNRDTLIGRAEVLSPLRFDEAINTKLYALNVHVTGDTVDFDLIEKNDILNGLGFDSLIHFARFVYSEAKINLKTSRFPPDPFQTLSDSVISFYKWLMVSDSLAYHRLINDNGKFRYGYESGKIMLDQIQKWRKHSR